MDRLNIINDWCKKNKRRFVSKQIVSAVLETFNTTEDKLRKSSKKESCLARNCIVWYIKQLTALSYERAAKVVHRSSSTTIYQKNKMNQLVKSCDADAVDALWHIYQQLKQLK